VSRIVSIATTVPAFSATQAELKATLRPLFPLDGRRLDAAMALFDNAEVETRHSVLSLPEFAHPRTLTETMKVYARNARELGQRVARTCLDRAHEDATKVDLIITVSCTGVMIPSLDAFLVDALGLRRDVRRLPITELGCVGGASAVARAHDFLRGHPEGHVLVISVELPSLSLQAADVSPDHLVSSAIFGDGAAAVLIAGDGVHSGDPPAADDANRAATGSSPSHQVRILATRCHTIAGSTHALGFDLHEDGFHPVLAKEVPGLLRAEVLGLVERLTHSAGVVPEDLVAFVLHPGGKKVLGAVEEALGLRRPSTQPSWDVLREYGNQSSASVLFVLERWMTAPRPAPGSLGVMAAFGPGLTAESLLLQWI
jgi:alkylresorcinol/alkylpyrone synthase